MTDTEDYGLCMVCGCPSIGGGTCGFPSCAGIGIGPTEPIQPPFGSPSWEAAGSSGQSHGWPGTESPSDLPDDDVAWYSDPGWEATTDDPTLDELDEIDRIAWTIPTEPTTTGQTPCAACQSADAVRDGYCMSCAPADEGPTRAWSDDPPGPLHELDLLTSLPTVEHSHGRLNQHFMREMLGTISASPGHPLEKLIECVMTADGAENRWLSRQADSDLPTVQAGHLISRHSRREERFALEDSSYNQVSSNRGETQGAIFFKDAVDIGGVPVELRTALMWERAGLLPTGTVENAPPHLGWTREEIGG